MSITIKDIKTPIKGVIHIGAGTITEAPDYDAVFQGPIYWFEATRESYLIGEENIKPYPNMKQFNVVLSDKNEEIDFFMAANEHNERSSSSLLPLKEHLKHHPRVKQAETRKVKARAFDDFMKVLKIDLTDVNIAIIDVQGAELKVLKGMEKHLINNVDELIVEVNTIEMYEGNPKPEEVEEYLASLSFKIINQEQISPGQAEQQYIKE